MQGGLRWAIFGICLLAALPAAAAAPVASDSLERYEFLQIQMGVPFRITLYARDEASANSASRAAYRRIKQLNAILSDYDPDSELSQLCRLSGSGKRVAAGPELFFVLSRANQLSRETGGAFDVTIGPVVRLWRKARRKKRLPAPEALAVAGELVGYESVRLDEESRIVELLKPGMRLDLGGIAKGYAADEALEVLREQGITRALIDGSGDIVVGDAPPGEEGWTIGIASLTKPNEKPTRFLSLRNSAVATSGDAYQAVVVDGIRYSHIVDPKTGLGLTRPSSVTVVAADGISADGLASAVSVLGPERGLELIAGRRETAALIVELHEGKPRAFRSSKFSAFELGFAETGCQFRRAKNGNDCER